MKKRNLEIILIILMFFLSLGALAGGILLIEDSSGGNFGFTLEMLEHSPFTNYLIPGLFLAIFLGVVPLIVGILLIKKYKHGLFLSNLIGILLLLWIVVEVIFLRDIAFLHIFYFLLGILIIVLATFISKLKVSNTNVNGSKARV